MSRGGIPWPSKKEVRTPDETPADQALIDLLSACDFNDLIVYTNEEDSVLLTSEDSPRVYGLTIVGGDFRAVPVDPDSVDFDALVRLSDD
jgi:hypothetical protein